EGHALLLGEGRALRVQRVAQEPRAAARHGETRVAVAVTVEAESFHGRSSCRSGGGPGHSALCWMLKTTVTVRMNCVGSPFSRSGLYRHCWTASVAGASRRGWPRRTFTDFTRPSTPTSASRMMMAETRALRASSG